MTTWWWSTPGDTMFNSPWERLLSRSGPANRQAPLAAYDALKRIRSYTKSLSTSMTSWSNARPCRTNVICAHAFTVSRSSPRLSCCCAARSRTHTLDTVFGLIAYGSRSNSTQCSSMALTSSHADCAYLGVRRRTPTNTHAAERTLAALVSCEARSARSQPLKIHLYHHPSHERFSCGTIRTTRGAYTGRTGAGGGKAGASTAGTG